VFVRPWRLGIKSISRDGPDRLCPGLGNLACEAPGDGEGLVAFDGPMFTPLLAPLNVLLFPLLEFPLLDENGFRLKIPPALALDPTPRHRTTAANHKDMRILAPPSPNGKRR
jgi:hypothetical protein